MDTQTLETQTGSARNRCRMKPVAVIILNWNGAELLRQFLPSVVAGTSPRLADIIVADNGSDDDSVEWVRQHYPEVTLLPFPENYGFAQGYNLSIEQAKAYEYVVLLNSDVETPDGWLEPLVAYADRHPEVAVCQPKLLSYRDKNRFEYAGAAGGFLDRYGYPFCRGRIFGTIEADNGQYDTPCDIFWASGATLFIRTRVYTEVGGLDPYFFAHMEEIDLCWRVHLAGYRIVCLPESRVYHLGGATLAASDPRKTYLNFRNNLLMLHKNLPPEEGRRLLFVRRLYDTLAWLKFMLTAHFADANALLKAHNDFRKSRKRYTAHPRENLLTTFDEARRNITVDYFLRRKKKF